MNPLGYARAASPAQAVATVARDPGAKFLAGGTNLVDLMKDGVERPGTVVDITRLDALSAIAELPDGSLRLGALATNSAAANHPLVRERHPLLSEAILAGASAQIRNAATVGGNILQRTRCHYFHDPASACNKREPGSGCAALGGFNRMHAVFGWSGHCIATNPSDMAVALAALDATVRALGPEGERAIPFAEFHRLPGDRPQTDTALRRDELVTAIDLAPSPFARHRRYLKVRDRASYAFALVSAAVALDVAPDRTVRAARIALGGVAHKPWRAADAERLLVGRPATEVIFAEAAEAAMRGARPHGHNAFKVELGRRAVARALRAAASAA